MRRGQSVLYGLVSLIPCRESGYTIGHCRAPWGVLRDIPQPGTSPFIQGNRPPRVVVSIEISLRARTSAVSAHAAPTMTLRCAPWRDDNQAAIGCVTFQKYATAMLT